MFEFYPKQTRVKNKSNLKIAGSSSSRYSMAGFLLAQK